jgi:hypothetical protein
VQGSQLKLNFTEIKRESLQEQGKPSVYAGDTPLNFVEDGKKMV